MLRYISFTFLLLLLCFTSLTATLSEADELASISSKIEENKKELKKKERVKKKEQANLNVINKDLRFTERRLKRTKNNLASTRRRITRTQERIRDLDKQYHKEKDLLQKRLVTIFKNKDTGWIGFIFMPSKFNEIIDSPYYFEQLLKLDLKLLDDVKTTHRSLAYEKKKLYRQKNDFSKLKKAMAKNEKHLSYKKGLQTKKISSLKNEIAKILKENRELEESSRRIGSTIRELAVKDRGFYGTGRLLKPVKGWLSSRFGMRKHPIFKRNIPHNGIDFAAPKGYRIRAADSGKVIVAGAQKRYRGYGKVTVIDHGRRQKDGKRVSTLYAHQSRILIKKGDFVKKGDEIGWVGSTGFATGPHLHFEMRIDGRPTDPLRFINKSYL